jgi:ATP-dependent Lon protease
MDPIIYFDELDKISKTHKGDEITNILVHLTDPVQNTHFRDKYFHGIDIDLSRATMIFSFNDPHNVNPILLDRITTVETKYLMISQKVHIASNYLLPEMMKEMGLQKNDVVLDDETIRHIINSYTHEGGVRKLKSLLYSIVRELNLANLIKGSIDKDIVKFPFRVEKRHVKTLLKHRMEIDPDKIHHGDKAGVVNGLWANSLGNGGLLEIETMLVPATSFLSVKATGHLEKVIKESTEVATSLAWNYLPDDVKTKYLADAKEKPLGIHIHCPDGATPKDGPSAGAALTLAIYSLLTNRKIKHDIAMTGEINLEGQVTAIGGLEEKLEGAKRAGVKMVLFPKENIKHLEKIKERNTTLIDDNFKVVPIESFDEVLKYSLI